MLQCIAAERAEAAFIALRSRDGVLAKRFLFWNLLSGVIYMDYRNVKKHIILVTAALMFVSGAAFAKDNTMKAKDLLKVCTTADMHWVDFCNGFFQAVHDQQSSFGKLCAPLGITRTNLVELYEQKATELMNKSPDEGERTAVDIAARVLIDAFPCK